MVYSMTGYGRCEVEANDRKITVEMNAINHRYCDLNIRMPRPLAYLEDAIRKQIKEQVTRGKFDVTITYQTSSQEDVEVVINEVLARNYIESLNKLGESLGLVNDIKLSALMNVNDLVTIQKVGVVEEAVSEVIQKAVDGALNSLIAMRLKEGTALKNDILSKAEGLSQMIDLIEVRSPQVVETYRNRLAARLSMLLDEVPVDEMRMTTEIALFADKCAIDEEITRLRSHIMQLCDILNEGGSIGRKLDFLMQEMNREVNTIGSKANDYEITSYVVSLKTEIEKIREQVQNIE